MPLIRIEVFRDGAWQVRQQGEANVTAAELAAMLPAYAIQYSHRGYLDGHLVAERQPERLIARRD